MLGMVRGDTARFKFQRLDNSGNVITTEADEVYFSVKRSAKEVTLQLQKTIDDMTFDEDGTYHFTIEPADTNNLDFTKKYFYDLEVIDNGVKTTISYGQFNLQPEVTWAANEGVE